MSDLSWLPEARMRRIEQYFPSSHSVPRMVDRRVISGTIESNLPVNRSGVDFGWVDRPR